MAKYEKGVRTAMKQLSNALTQNDIDKIHVILPIPTRIIEIVKASNEPGIELIHQLKKWEEFNPVEFMRTIELLNNRELLSLARKIPWLNASAIQQVAAEKKTAHTFINVLRDIAVNDWRTIAYDITTSQNTEEILNCCIQEGIVTKDLTMLCDVMTEIDRHDLVPKIQKYASVFEGLSEEEFKTKLLSEVEYEGEDNHSQWVRKLREYMLLQNREVIVILDKEMVALKSVYTPLTVIKQETDRVKPEEETTVKEIEFLREMNKEQWRYETNSEHIESDPPESDPPESDPPESDSAESDSAEFYSAESDSAEYDLPEYDLPESDSAESGTLPREKNGCEGESGIVDFESHLSHCRTEKPEVWTLIGNPGCGKTFLCKYAGYQYGMDNIENFQYLLCIPCRDTEWHEIEMARQEDNEVNKYILRWLRISLPLGVGWAESLTRYLMRTGGESLLLIIDGLDEFIKTVPFDTTLLYLLLQKRILPSATILLTSRPGAWSNVFTQFKNEMKINSHYQVLGFSPDNRDAYFKKRMVSESKLEETNKLFERHEELNLLALVPVNASLFSALFNDTENILAQTITDVYQELITYMVRRQLSRIGIKSYTKVTNISGFAQEIKGCISIIGGEAYKGIYDRELVCKDDVSLCLREKEYKCERLGLMQEHFVVLKLMGRVKVWVYAHLTLQEFMSAVWLSYQKWTQQCLITRYLVSPDELFVMFRMVFRFVCGILCDRSVAMQSILCKKLIPYATPQIPMYYQLAFDLDLYSLNKMLDLSNWKEFSRILLELIPTIFESKPVPSLSYVKHILPEPLHFYIVSVVSPNEWYTFLLSLPHLPHIQIIYIDVSYLSTEQFYSLISRLDECSLNYLALAFVKKDTSTILSYTSIISSHMPAHIKISITLDKCRDIGDSDILFPPPANQFTGSLGIHETDISKECITDLFSEFSSIQYIYYELDDRPNWSVQELLTHHKPSEGLFLLESYSFSFDMPLDIFSLLTSLQEIHLSTEDPYSVLPHLQSFCTLTYLALRPIRLAPDHKSYGDILIQIINRNSNTLRVIMLYGLYSIGFNSWDSILALIQHCNKLIELEIRNIGYMEIIFRNTSVDYLQSLIKLSLCRIALSSSEVYTLCDGLAYSPFIKEIEISHCKLDSTSCVDLIHLIPTLPQLKKLDVSWNDLSSPDPTQVEILRETAEEYSVECYIYNIS